MRILVVGCEGQVGKELIQMARDFNVAAVGKGRQDFDVSVLTEVEKTVGDLRPECIINAAAYTAVDAAELDTDRAFAVNEGGAKNLAQICAKRQIPLIHISTEYVFDGNKKGKYKETDPVNPLNVYGASKAAGEKAIIEYCPASIILRTSWVYSEHGNNFVKTMLKLGAERELLSVVADQYGGPTAARDIAHTLLDILSKLPDMLALDEHPWGLFHYSGKPKTSWYEFSEAIFSLAREAGKPLLLKNLSSISSKNYPTQAQRPENSVLDCSKIKKIFDIDQPDWRNSLKTVVYALCK